MIGAAVLRPRAEDLADAALLDDGVAFRPEARAHEQVLNVAQAGQAAVDQVLAFARPVQAPGDGDFARLVGRVLRVVHGHGDQGHAGGLAIARSGEDHVFHSRPTQALCGLFAQHPTDGVAQVRLAAAVRTHNRRDSAAVEPEFGAIAKRFKTMQLEPLQP